MARQDWFASRAAGRGLTMLAEPFVHDYVRANIWHLTGRDCAGVLGLLERDEITFGHSLSLRSSSYTRRV